MGKRSDFKRRPQDAYDTPLEAVLPLIPHLPTRAHFAEPCVGNGDLVRALEIMGHLCLYSNDIKQGQDALLTTAFFTEYIITNPPWTRQILHPMINHFHSMRPTWLLFDADWAHTKQAIPYLPYCHKIVSVGRVKWIPDSPHTGKDNAAWYLFDRDPAPTEFIGRAA